MVEQDDEGDSEAEVEDFADAADLAQLRRRYAGVLSASPLADAYDLQDTRAAFVRQRQALKHRKALAATDLATPDAWFRAFVAATASREVLGEALELLAPNTRARHEAVLKHYTAWTAARYDPGVARDLLRHVVHEFRPGTTPPALGDRAALGQAALAARRRHPGLVALAPTLFRQLLLPTYKTAEAHHVRRRAPQAAPSASPTSRRQRTRTPSASSPTWVWILVAVMAMGILRACNSRRFTGDSDVDDNLRNIRRQLDEIDQRGRERRERWKQRDQDDDAPRGGR